MRKTWTVIGGGPCGIATVGRLVDYDDVNIVWIDPTFSCGRMGLYYKGVPANTTNEDLIRALRLCSSFRFEQSQQCRRNKGEKVISDLPPEKCANLGYLVDALDDITVQLMQRVKCIKGEVGKLSKQDRGSHWDITINLAGTYTDDCAPMLVQSDAVILCCGAVPKALPALQATQLSCKSHDVGWYNMDLMVDPTYCSELLNSTPSIKEEGIAVFGSSHSAMLICKNLVENGATRVINIYRSELRFMHVTDEGWTQYKGIGLKGPVGEWVRDHLSPCTIHSPTLHPVMTRIRYKPIPSLIPIQPLYTPYTTPISTYIYHLHVQI